MYVGRGRGVGRIRGMGLGQTCDAGYTFNSSSGVCESNATYTAGSFCMASSFPFVGQTGDSSTNFSCVPFSPIIGYGLVGALALILLKGGRR
jgi:hypothetical protein